MEEPEGLSNRLQKSPRQANVSTMHGLKNFKFLPDVSSLVLPRHAWMTGRNWSGNSMGLFDHTHSLSCLRDVLSAELEPVVNLYELVIRNE